MCIRAILAWTIRGLKEYARVVFGRKNPKKRGTGMHPKFNIKRTIVSRVYTVCRVHEDRKLMF